MQRGPFASAIFSLLIVAASAGTALAQGRGGGAWGPRPGDGGPTRLHGYAVGRQRLRLGLRRYRLFGGNRIFAPFGRQVEVIDPARFMAELESLPQGEEKVAGEEWLAWFADPNNRNTF